MSFSDLSGFARHFSSIALKEYEWRGNLDAFNDILRGGFGTPDGGFILIWRKHEKSIDSLGQDLFATLIEIIRTHGAEGEEAEDGVELQLC
mgnify:FL=1